MTTGCHPRTTDRRDTASSTQHGARPQEQSNIVSTLALKSSAPCGSPVGIGGQLLGLAITAGDITRFALRHEWRAGLRMAQGLRTSGKPVRRILRHHSRLHQRRVRQSSACHLHSCAVTHHANCRKRPAATARWPQGNYQLPRNKAQDSGWCSSQRPVTGVLKPLQPRSSSSRPTRQSWVRTGSFGLHPIAHPMSSGAVSKPAMEHEINPKNNRPMESQLS